MFQRGRSVAIRLPRSMVSIIGKVVIGRSINADDAYKAMERVKVDQLIITGECFNCAYRIANNEFENEGADGNRCGRCLKSIMRPYWAHNGKVSVLYTAKSGDSDTRITSAEAVDETGKVVGKIAIII